MKKWYYLEQKGSDRKVGLCFNDKNGIIELVTRYDAEAGRRVYASLYCWDDDIEAYTPCYIATRGFCPLCDIRRGLKNGKLKAM